jgi:hypothetical protein
VHASAGGHGFGHSKIDLAITGLLAERIEFRIAMDRCAETRHEQV